MFEYPKGETLLIILGLLPPLLYWGVARFFAPGKIKPKLMYVGLAAIGIAEVLLYALASGSQNWVAAAVWTVAWILAFALSRTQTQMHKRVLELFDRSANEGPAPLDIAELHRLLCDLAAAYPGKGTAVSYQPGNRYPCLYMDGHPLGLLNMGQYTPSELINQLTQRHPQAVRESPAEPLACMFVRRPDGRVWLVGYN